MNRTHTWLLAWAALLLWPSAVWSQSYQEPIEPFAQPDLSLYGNPPGPPQGYYGSIEALNWAISRPETTQFGLPRDIVIPNVVTGLGLGPERSTHDTGALTSDVQFGHRLEVGRMERNHGWQVSYFGVNGSPQRTTCSNADVVFQDAVIPNIFPAAGYLSGFTNLQQPDGLQDDDWNANGLFGRYFDGDGDGVVDATNIADHLPPYLFDYGDLQRLPVVFRTLNATLLTKIWGIELMPTFRSRPMHGGGYWDFMAGARYFSFDEQFNVLASGGVLDESYWNTRAFNNLAGPQVGVRWTRTKGRFTVTADGRFMAAANFQSVHQKGQLASNLLPTVNNQTLTTRPPGVPAFLSRTQFTNNQHQTEWAPLGELRAQAHFKITKGIGVSAGYNAIFAGGIARPNSMVVYQMPSMGLNGNNRQDVFVQGVNFGLEFNR